MQSRARSTAYPRAIPAPAERAPTPRPHQAAQASDSSNAFTTDLASPWVFLKLTATATVPLPEDEEVAQADTEDDAESMTLLDTR
eukprot:3171295-Alexandrium_andersonii.AAC.1